jgi:hypothetical protein
VKGQGVTIKGRKSEIYSQPRFGDEDSFIRHCLDTCTNAGGFKATGLPCGGVVLTYRNNKKVCRDDQTYPNCDVEKFNPLKCIYKERGAVTKKASNHKKDFYRLVYEGGPYPVVSSSTAWSKLMPCWDNTVDDWQTTQSPWRVGTPRDLPLIESFDKYLKEHGSSLQKNLTLDNCLRLCAENDTCYGPSWFTKLKRQYSMTISVNESEKWPGEHENFQARMPLFCAALVFNWTSYLNPEPLYTGSPAENYDIALASFTEERWQEFLKNYEIFIEPIDRDFIHRYSKSLKEIYGSDWRSAVRMHIFRLYLRQPEDDTSSFTSILGTPLPPVMCADE